MCKLSIITIVFNNKDGLEKTFNSIFCQTYDDFEYIVIDGGSTDGSVELANSLVDSIDYYVSEKDNGIYDAMNKGLSVARGEWVSFMNSGDAFADCNVLSKIFSDDFNADFIYSDVFFLRGGLFVCSKQSRRIVHQSLLYKRSMHDIYGNYIVYPGFTCADYFFFQCASNARWVKTSTVIAVYDDSGVSTSLNHFKQRIAIDIALGSVGRLSGAFILLIHPVYNFLKNKIRSLYGFCLRRDI
jgi:glycosyltransferase involved in cell wall biosynthesis